MLDLMQVKALRRMPRKGSIRLGMKKTNPAGKEYPVSTDYFVCPPEVQQKFGEKPTELEIRFISDDPDKIFPQYYALYGKSTGLKAVSRDGKILREKKPNAAGDKYEWTERATTLEELEKEQFKALGRLEFMIPKVTMAEVYTLTTSSFNSIVNINSILDLLKHWINRVSFIPLKLCLVKQEVNLLKDGQPFKKAVHVLQLKFENEKIMEFVQSRQAVLETMQDQPKLAEAAAESDEADDVDPGVEGEIFGQDDEADISAAVKDLDKK